MTNEQQKVVQWAVKEHENINRSNVPRLWATLEIIQNENEEVEPIIRMEIGKYSFDGVKQIRQVTRNYFYDYNRNEVFWHNHLHS